MLLPIHIQPEQRHTQNTSTVNSIIAGIHNERDDTFSSKLIIKGKELKEDSKTNSSRRKRTSVCVKSAKCWSRQIESPSSMVKIIPRLVE